MNLIILREKSGRFQQSILAFILYGVAVLMTACVTAPSTSTVQPESYQPGLIGIISSAAQPNIEIVSLPSWASVDLPLASTTGVPSGCYQDFGSCLVGSLLLGMLEGYLESETREGATDKVRPVTEKFTKVLLEIDWQSVLRQKVVELATAERSNSVSDLGATQPLSAETNQVEMQQGFGSSYAVETVHAADVVPYTLSANADTVMEVALAKIYNRISWDYKFGFFLRGQVQLKQNPDATVIASSTHNYESPLLPLSEWDTHDGILIRETMMTGIEQLAREMVREHLPVN